MSDTHAKHEEIFLLLPWYVNETLQTHERQLVEEHLGECLVCHREVEQLHLHADAVCEYDAAQLDPEHQFEKLMQRIDRSEVSSIWSFKKLWSSALDTLKHPLPSPAWGISVLLLGVITIWHIRGNDENIYHTLSNDMDISASLLDTQIRAVFDEASTMGELSILLDRCRLNIVVGPSQAGVYTLQTEPEYFNSALACLRDSEQVRFAEPLNLAVKH